MKTTELNRKTKLGSLKIQRIHAWLRYHYGRADVCENPNCKGRSKLFEYSLINGKNYGRKRENFRKLCKCCHEKYDWDNGKYPVLRKIFKTIGTRTGKINGRKRCKLTQDDATAVRNIYKMGKITQKQLGVLFGVDQTIVSKVINFVTYA